METVELLKTLTDAFGPSGFEEEICETLQRIIAPYVDEMRVDPLGNLIAIKRGTGDRTLMLDEHMISWQYRIPLGGGTNAGAIQRSRGGVMTGVVSLPVRYFHSPYALMRLDDFHETVRLVEVFVRTCHRFV